MTLMDNSRETRVAVRDLWKVFGPDGQRVLQEDGGWAQSASREQVQEKTGHVIAIRDISFDVHVGEVFVVMGLSGSGKSTLVRCLIRLIEPTQGIVEIDGENVLEYDVEQIIELRRHKTGMVFQHYGLFPHRNVMDNVAYGLEVQGIEKESRYATALDVLARVGLKGWEESYPDELSGGMQQRVGIARALALDPEILLMDEPFSGLDPLIRRQMQDELIELQKQLHKTIVFITHDLLEALKLGDRIAILRGGSMVQLGTPEQIVMTPADDYVEEFVKDVSKARVMRVTSIMRPPALVLEHSQRLHSAVTLLRENNADAAFVAQSDGSYAGMVTLEGLSRAEHEGSSDLSAAIDDSADSVSPETSVQDLIPMVAGTRHPIAVVDEKRLLGEVDRPIVLDSLAESHAARAG